MEIQRINSYDDARFAKNVLYQHGCFLIDGEPCEVEIVSDFEAVVRGQNPQTYQKAIRIFVKRNFLRAGKSYTIKGKQAEKKAENALCGRLKCVLVAGNIKPLPTS